MALPIFNLAETIQRYNESENNKRKKNYELNYSFGFVFFESEFLNETNALIQYLNHGIDKEFFTDGERNHLRAKKAHTAQLRKYYKGTAPYKTEFPVSDAKEAAKDKTYYHEWIQYQRNQINQILKPEVPAAATQNHSLREQIKREWHKQADFICHTHNALLDAAKHLPELISYHQLARKELNSFRTTCLHLFVRPIKVT